MHMEQQTWQTIPIQHDFHTRKLGEGGGEEPFLPSNAIPSPFQLSTVAVWLWGTWENQRKQAIKCNI